MQDPTPSHTGAPLHRALNIRDLVMLNIVITFGFTSLAQVAQFGYASFLLYAMAIFTFLIPSGLAVAELNSRMPEEGGFYLWTREALGDTHAYIAAWTYWVSNIVWFPTLLLLASTSALYIFGEAYLGMADDPVYSACMSLGILWAVIILNILGIEKAKWIQNVGGTAVWMGVGLLVVTGLSYMSGHESAHSFSPDKLFMDFTDLSVLGYFGMVAFCFGGLEMSSIMAGEIQRPRRTIPLSILISSVVVGGLYMLATLMLIRALPEGDVSIIGGVPQAFGAMAASLETPWLGALGALLVAVATVGMLGGWSTGIARLPFVIGMNHYLPDALAKVHPRWGSPWVSLLMQGVAVSVLLLLATAGSTVKEAFLVLLDMSVILYFIPFLYIFAVFVIHALRNINNPALIGAFHSRVMVWIVGGLGFTVTLVSAIASAVPTRDVENKELFVLKVVGGTALFIAVGLSFYYAKKWRQK
jgi:amino acid transporter